MLGRFGKTIYFSHKLGFAKTRRLKGGRLTAQQDEGYVAALKDQFRCITEIDWDAARWQTSSPPEDGRIPQRVKLLRYLLERVFAAAEAPKPKEAATDLFGDLSMTNHVNALATQLRGMLRSHAGRMSQAEKFEILMERGLVLTFRARSLAERFLPQWLVRLTRFVAEPAEITPSIFLTAVSAPVIWILTCRAFGWPHYLGGSGNEPAGWRAVVWATTSGLPIVIYEAFQLWRISSIDLRPRHPARWAALVLVQFVAACGGGASFYLMEFRKLVEGIGLPVAPQELMIASIWCACFAVPVLFAGSLMFRWRAWDILRLATLQCIAPVTALIFLLQAIIPSTATPPGCAPHLAVGASGGVIIAAPPNCHPLPANIVFDQARGLLAGVAMPFFVTYALMRFVKAVGSKDAPYRWEDPDPGPQAAANSPIR